MILYSQDADADRAALRDVLGFSHVDVGGGWLIFALPPAEVAVHPADGPPQHELYLMCDDVEATIASFDGTGIEVTKPVEGPTGWFVDIRNDASGEAAEHMGPMTEREARETARGAGINLDHSSWSIVIVEPSGREEWQ